VSEDEAHETRGTHLSLADGRVALLLKAINLLFVLAQIHLGRDQDQLGVGAVVLDLRHPLGLRTRGRQQSAGAKKKQQPPTLTFWNEVGDTMEKHTRKTSVCG
jgi:hypothetical protein